MHRVGLTYPIVLAAHMFSFTPTPSQQSLLLAARADAKTFRKRLAGNIKNHTYPMEIIRGLGRKKLASPRIPEGYGGMGADALTTGLIVEELAKEGDPNLTVNLGAAEVLIRHGSNSQRKYWLPKLASGKIIAGIASTEPRAGSDAASIVTSARKEGKYYSISGEKRYIDVPNTAAFLLLTAKTSKTEGSRGISLFLLPMDSKGISKYRLGHMGVPWLDFGGFRMRNVSLPAENLIAEEGRGFPVLMETFDFMRVIVGLKCVGIASKALELTIDHVKRRHAFGRPIGKFEAVQFRIVEDYTQLEAARLLCYRALFLKDHGQRITKEAAMVKSWIPELTFKIVNDCLQNMGALGYSSATPIASMLTHIRGYSIGDGTPDIMKIIVGRELLGQDYLPYR